MRARFAHLRSTGSAKLAGRRGAAALSVGTLASGLFAYAFNALAARTLGPDRFGPVAVLWAATFIVAVVLFRPFEQTLSRALAERRARGEDGRSPARAVARLMAIVAFVACAGTLAAWEPVTRIMFNGNGALTVALAAGIAGYAASYYVRGLVGGLRWFGAYGALLLADGGVRLLLAVPLLFIASTTLAGVAVAAAAFAGALAPLALRSWRRRVRLDGDPAAPFAAGHALRFAAPATAIAASDQILLNGGPLLVVAAGGPHAVRTAGIVFAATMLVRAPAFLFQGLAAALLPSLTTFRANGDDARLRRAVGRTVMVLAAVAVTMALAALVAGPQAMRMLYGAGYAVGRLDLVVLALGVGCYLAASTLSQAALARDEVARAGLTWMLSAATFVGAELVLAGTAFHRVSFAFALAGVVNAIGFTVLVVRGSARDARRVAVTPVQIPLEGAQTA